MPAAVVNDAQSGLAKVTEQDPRGAAGGGLARAPERRAGPPVLDMTKRPVRGGHVSAG